MAIPREKTPLENYLIYGVDLKNRRIFFGHPLDWGHPSDDEMGYNDFTEASIEIAVRAIKRMEKDHPNHRIELYMNSGGGDSRSMLYLKDIIEHSTCPFTFYGGGQINSSATWIMAICDQRLLYPETTVILHNGSGHSTGTYDDVKIDIEREKRHMDHLVDIYVENSRMPKNFYKTILKRDCEVSAEDAILMGLACGYVPKPKRGNLRKQRIALLKKQPHHATMKKLINKLYARVGMEGLGEITLNLPAEEEYDSNVIIDNSPIIGSEE